MSYRTKSKEMISLLNQLNVYLILSVIIIAITLVSYWNIQYAGFVNYDDPDYITNNIHVKRGLNWDEIKWAFSVPDRVTANWHPLTWISYMLDYELYGLNAGGFHITNLYIHIANTILLLLCFQKMTSSIGPSSLVAILFALHPLHVESVAWISERKDVLSTFFFMLTILIYWQYTRKPNSSRYLLFYTTFLLGLMAKQMIVTMPFILLLLDIWPLKRFSNNTYVGDLERKDKYDCCRIVHKIQTKLFLSDKVVLSLYLIVEKIPLLILSAIFSYIAVIAQHMGGAISTIEELSLKMRIENALVSYCRYIWKTIWPQDLTAFYPYISEWSNWQVICALGFLVIVTSFTIIEFRRRPYLTVGWFWFIGTLVPVLGIVQVGSQSMADRYTYIPLIGLFVALSWSIYDALSSMANRKIIFAIVVTLFATGSMVLTYHQAMTWQNDELLYKNMLHVSKNNYQAFNGLGIMHLNRNELDEAMKYFQKTLEIKPDFAAAYQNIGVIYIRKKRYNEAISELRKAITMEYLPDNLAMAHNHLGVAYVCSLKIDEAIEEFKISLQIVPDFEKAKNNLLKTYRLKEKISNSISVK